MHPSILLWLIWDILDPKLKPEISAIPVQFCLNFKNSKFWQMFHFFDPQKYEFLKYNENVAIRLKIHVPVLGQIFPKPVIVHLKGLPSVEESNSNRHNLTRKVKVLYYRQTLVLLALPLDKFPSKHVYVKWKKVLSGSVLLLPPDFCK